MRHNASPTPQVRKEIPRPTPQSGVKARDPNLWQVIPERREEHILRRIWSSAYATPNVAVDVRVLRPPLKSALRATVEAIPKPDSAFDDVPRIAVAIGQPARVESAGQRRTHRTGNRNCGGAASGAAGSGWGDNGDSRGCWGCLGAATRVIEQRRSVANAFSRTADERSPVFIFAANVGVNIQPRRVPLQRAQRLIIPHRNQDAIGTSYNVCESSAAVTSGAIAAEEMRPDIDVLGDGPAYVGADTAVGR